MIGHCSNKGTTMFLTENCGKYGSLDRFVMNGAILTFNATQRLYIMIQIIECFVFLHYKSGSPRVNCDLHNPLQVMNKRVNFLLLGEEKNFLFCYCNCQYFNFLFVEQTKTCVTMQKKTLTIS